jgi:hypothetical protein
LIASSDIAGEKEQMADEGPFRFGEIYGNMGLANEHRVVCSSVPLARCCCDQGRSPNHQTRVCCDDWICLRVLTRERLVAKQQLIVLRLLGLAGLHRGIEPNPASSRYEGRPAGNAEGTLPYLRISAACDLYSLHTTQETMRQEFGVSHNSAGNVPSPAGELSGLDSACHVEGRR